jgi:hypothetical protein
MVTPSKLSVIRKVLSLSIVRSTFGLNSEEKSVGRKWNWSRGCCVSWILWNDKEKWSLYRFHICVYYESRKRDLKRRLINEGRWDERQKFWQTSGRTVISHKNKVTKWFHFHIPSNTKIRKYETVSHSQQRDRYWCLMTNNEPVVSTTSCPSPPVLRLQNQHDQNEEFSLETLTNK